MAPEKIADIVRVPPFNVTTGAYATFVGQVRDKLAGARPATVGRPNSKVSRPVLARQNPPDRQPPMWIHAVLNGKGGSSPTVAIRSDDAYVMGFTNADGKWYQLTKAGTKLVDGNAEMLGFDGNYTTLLGGEELTTLKLNKFQLADAAAVLWKHGVKAPKTTLTDDDDDDDDDDDSGMLRAALTTKTALATIAVAVCEAARFIRVSDAIGKGWNNEKQGVRLTPREADTIREWGDLSTALLKWKEANYNDNNNKTLFQDKFGKIGIANGDQALAVVGLVKFVSRRASLLAWLNYFWGFVVKKLHLQRQDTTIGEKHKPKTSAVINPL